ncbi:16S rRNA (uracil(1498)-N(3))-methyltransferase [Alkalinema pantanalense CENA528]|uniref:16S rRNA (uracil(1498)-N(3))-methyltransferase n=1 Tax=Alkalinema pantanalense TaxID=1620705 RepID=UPI003D6F2711
MSQIQRIVITPGQLQPPTLHLTQDQTHYLTRVLRLQPTDRFIAMTGQGDNWLAQLEQPGLATLLEPLAVRSELPVTVTLALALPKGNAFDEVVRQVTELGVSRIVPILSDRTLLQPSANKLDRWRKIAQEAAEQSERAIVPTIAEPMAWKQHLQAVQAQPPGSHFLCWGRGNSPHLMTPLQGGSDAQKRADLVIAIGPEGGWTNAEVEQGVQAGYQTVSLGPRILRAVTAPVVAMAIISAIFEK